MIATDPDLLRQNELTILRRIDIPVDDPLMQQLLRHCFFGTDDWSLLVFLDLISAPDTVWLGRSLLSMIRDGDEDAAEHVRCYITQVETDGFS